MRALWISWTGFKLCAPEHVSQLTEDHTGYEVLRDAPEAERTLFMVCQDPSVPWHSTLAMAPVPAAFCDTGNTRVTPVGGRKPRSRVVLHLMKSTVLMEHSLTMVQPQVPLNPAKF